MPTNKNAFLLQGIETFFNAIKSKCLSYEEYAAEILKARGFLLEDKGLILSDNSFFARDRIRRIIPKDPMNDAVYLNKLLSKENIGKVDGDKIIIFPGGDVEKIFYRDLWIGFETFTHYPQSWGNFIWKNFAPKIPVGILEPFVARYVKAISACGVTTEMSCDGNHSGGRLQRIFIELRSGPSVIWHKIICQRCLADRFNLRWNEGSAEIFLENFFDRKDKWKTYIELNRAAEFLYNHRIEIRAIRRKACDGITDEMLKTLSDAELTEIFYERANKLFDELIFNNGTVHCD